jgi:hypothetical protein
MYRRNRNSRKLMNKRRTSVCKSGVTNLGNNPRVFGAAESLADGLSRELPSRRSPRNYLPAHPTVLETLLRCLPISLPNGEGRDAISGRFRDAMKEGKGQATGEPHVCGTPLRWISRALPREYDISPVRSLDDIMGVQGLTPGTGDFFLMDVILNRELVRSLDAKPRNPDDVVMASAKWDPANIEPEFDFKYRALVAYLPGAGSFYCTTERRPAAVGRKNTLVHHDASWLRISESVGAPTDTLRFSFGADGFVRRFSEESTSGVSAWRVSCGTGRAAQRFVFMAKQCADSDGPLMPPDTVKNRDISGLSVAKRRAKYNAALAASKAAKVGGRHHVGGSLYWTVADDCLVINGNDSCPHMDIVVDIAPRGSFRARKSVVRVRNLLSNSFEANFVGRNGEPLLIHELRTILLHNAILRKRCRVGGARGSQGDVGHMYPIGTRVMWDGVTTTSYSATHKVSRQLVEAYVKALSRVGQIAFPDVLAVIQDTEGDTGFQPCGMMAGDAAGNRVGASIDSSTDLGNSSHYDTGDVTPGYSAWLEEYPGMASNWYFILPNVYGTLPDGSGTFNGIAIKLRHGTAISWDGRLIRHCTSVARPDGPGGCLAGSGEHINHLYGTFTAAKEKIVECGRKRAAKIQMGDITDYHVENPRDEEGKLKLEKDNDLGHPIGVRATRVHMPVKESRPDTAIPDYDLSHLVGPIGVRVPRVHTPARERSRPASEVAGRNPATPLASTNVVSDPPDGLLPMDYVIPRKKRRRL